MTVTLLSLTACPAPPLIVTLPLLALALVAWAAVIYVALREES